MAEPILGLISEREWIDVGFNVRRDTDPLDALVGDMRTNNLMASWQSIAAEYQIPVMANFHAFDTESRKTFRVPVDTHNIEKGLIKVKINQSERLRALTRTGVREDEIKDYVLNDGISLADQVVTRSKVAKAEMLATGKITIKENNLDLTVDYGVPTAQTEKTINTAEGQDVPSQIQAIVDAAATSGVILTGLIAGRATLTKLRQHKSVQQAINGVNGVGAIVSMSAFEAWLLDEFGINNVVMDDLTYNIEGSIDTNGRPKLTNKRYFPLDTITFFAPNPAGMVGTGLWGDPPEVDVNQLMQVNASGESPYVYVSQWTEHDPAVLWTKASALFIPLLYNPNSLWIAKVNAGE